MSTGTQTEVVMPQMGVSVSEGTVTKWLRQVGDAIGRDEPLLEISTDKVDTEVPSPAEGVVTQILVQEGETVEVGTVLATIAPAGAEIPPPAAEPAPEPAATPAAPAAAPAPEPEPVVAAAAPPALPQPSPPRPLLQLQRPQRLHLPCRRPRAENGRTFVSPVVARIAAEHGVDPAAVPGTGTGGRVTKKDILSFIESGAAAAPPPAPTPAPPVEVAPPPAPEPVAVAEPAAAPSARRAAPEPEPAPVAAAPAAAPAAPHPRRPAPALLRRLRRPNRLQRRRSSRRARSSSPCPRCGAA